MAPHNKHPTTVQPPSSSLYKFIKETKSYSLYKFKPNSNLRNYAISHFRSNRFRTIKPSKQLHTLQDILHELNDIISDKKLYDVTNPIIINCDPDMTTAFNEQTLTTHEALTNILKQLTLVHTPEPPNPNPNQYPFPLPNTTLSNFLCNISRATKTTKNPASCHTQRSIANRFLKKFSTQTNSHRSNPFNLPPLTLLEYSSLPNMHKDHPLYSDNQTTYTFTTKLRLILRTSPHPPSRPQRPLTYIDSYKTLFEYILRKRLRHPTNESIILVKDNPLGELFGVNTFHIHQLHYFLQNNTVTQKTSLPSP